MIGGSQGKRFQEEEEARSPVQKISGDALEKKTGNKSSKDRTHRDIAPPPSSYFHGQRRPDDPLGGAPLFLRGRKTWPTSCGQVLLSQEVSLVDLRRKARTPL